MVKVASFGTKRKLKETDLLSSFGVLKGYTMCVSQDGNKNILYHLTEFKYVREHIENAIKNLLMQTFNNETPFMIHDSWLNILDKNGYQEFHRHTEDDGSGVLYLTDDNSAIEFAIFPDDLRTQVEPKKCDLLLFDSSTFHRVLESKQERFSLAFNFKVGK